MANFRKSKLREFVEFSQADALGLFFLTDLCRNHVSEDIAVFIVHKKFIAKIGIGRIKDKHNNIFINLVR